jgi:hypothetical protein
VIDTGLHENNKDFVCQFPKVHLWDTEIRSQFNGLHDAEWGKSNYAKLPVIKEILLTDKIPTYFIDVDCVFLQDYYHLLDFDKDITITTTADRKSLVSTRFIGSFYGFNNVEKAHKFIDKWYGFILEPERYAEAWKESPALCEVFDIFQEEYTFQILMEGQVSASLFSPSSPETCIMHMKSEGAYGFKTPHQRLHMPFVIRHIERYKHV